MENAPHPTAKTNLNSNTRYSAAKIMQKLFSKQHWIFDMDGTLTIAVHDFQGIRKTLGLPAEEPILEVLAAMPEQESAPLYAELDRIELELARQAKAADKAAALLNTLQQGGVKLGILTRNSVRNALETLAACELLHYFEDSHIIGRETAKPKPEPEGIHKLLELWNAEAHDTVMVGDYLFDLQAGRAAGTTTLYVDISGEFPFADEADHCVKSLGHLLA